MNPIAASCADAAAFAYPSIDRLILKAYIPHLQTPAAMAVFLREVRRRPILAGKVFKDLTDGFVQEVTAFARPCPSSRYGPCLERPPLAAPSPVRTATQWKLHQLPRHAKPARGRPNLSRAMDQVIPLDTPCPIPA